MLRSKASHLFPAGCTCWSRPLPLTHETSPAPVEPLHLGFSPDAFSCNRSPGDDLPVSLGDAGEVKVQLTLRNRCTVCVLVIKVTSVCNLPVSL